MADILGCEWFISAKPIEKGWSEDKKFCVTDKTGKKYLLRISPIARYDTHKTLFEMLEKIAALGTPMCLPIEKRIKVFEDILAFHAFVCGGGYVAIDFYDGSIMYDYENEKTMICDIDFYQKMPYRGEMGLWGSTRFVSPEECKQDEIMDEVTTVYTMGATAFCLFTDSDRSREAWPLSEAQYTIVKKATNNKRDERQQSVKQLITEWDASKI